MRRVFVVSMLCLFSLSASGQEDCALLLFPESYVDQGAFSAVRAINIIKQIFPAGLYPNPGLYPRLTKAKKFPVLDDVEITTELDLPNLGASKILYAQTWYRGFNGSHLEESLARYSIVHWANLDKVTNWIIEHPIRGRIGAAEEYYAAYSANRARPAGASVKIRLKPVPQIKDARLAMYLAALAVPKEQRLPNGATWFRPILRPMLSRQVCTGNVCSSRVQVRAVYSRFRLRGRESDGENPLFFNFTVNTQDGQLKQMNPNVPGVFEVDSRLVWALETIADQL